MPRFVINQYKRNSGRIKLILGFVRSLRKLDPRPDLSGRRGSSRMKLINSCSLLNSNYSIDYLLHGLLVADVL